MRQLSKSAAFLTAGSSLIPVSAVLTAELTFFENLKTRQSLNSTCSTDCFCFYSCCLAASSQDLVLTKFSSKCEWLTTAWWIQERLRRVNRAEKAGLATCEQSACDVGMPMLSVVAEESAGDPSLGHHTIDCHIIMRDMNVHRQSLCFAIIICCEERNHSTNINMHSTVWQDAYQNQNWDDALLAFIGNCRHRMPALRGINRLWPWITAERIACPPCLDDDNFVSLCLKGDGKLICSRVRCWVLVTVNAFWRATRRKAWTQAHGDQYSTFVLRYKRLRYICQKLWWDSHHCILPLLEDWSPLRPSFPGLDCSDNCPWSGSMHPLSQKLHMSWLCLAYCKRVWIYDITAWSRSSDQSPGTLKGHKDQTQLPDWRAVQWMVLA